MDPLGSGKAGSPGRPGTFGPHTSTAADATTHLPADLWTVPPLMLTASDSAAAGLEPGRPDVLEGHDGSDAPRPALFGRPVVKVWALTAVLAALALAVYAQGLLALAPISRPYAVPAASLLPATAASRAPPRYLILPPIAPSGCHDSPPIASLARLAVSVLVIHTAAIWLLIVPVATLYAAYRAYVSEREKHERLE